VFGYNEDARTPAEFDITPHVVEGNERAGRGGFTAGATVRIVKTRTCSSLSGIFRDVYLWSTAASHIRDFEHRAET